MRRATLPMIVVVTGSVLSSCSASEDSVTTGATGGAMGTGGLSASTGGTNGSTGTLASGGSSSLGGATGSGGTATSSTTTSSSACTDAEKTVTASAIGQHCGYTYEYWKDSGNGTMVLTSDGFTVAWDSINNLLARKGIRPGSAALSVTYSADYQPNGNSYLCVYGWTQNPLIEYYIVDSWGDWRPPGTTAIATVQSDGGTYEVYKTQRVDQPSIEGTATFYQYWSVRTEKRTSGTITVANHFNAWETQGLTLGTFYEVSMTVEGYQSQGTADVSLSIQ